MPITREEFDSSESPETEYSTAEAIVRHLAANAELAFTRREIADAIDRDANTVSTNLTRLKDRGFVQHRGEYWALTNDESRLREFINHSDTLSSEATEFDDETAFIEDEEEAAAWAETAAEYPDEENAGQTETSMAERSNDDASRSES